MIQMKNVAVDYGGKYLALKDINLSIEEGEFVGIIGLSGSGKSTLLKTMNGLVQLSRGDICIGHYRLDNISNKSLRSLRKEMGFVFQDYNLIESETVIENILMGRLGYKSYLQAMLGLYSNQDYIKSMHSLEKVDLSEKAFVKAKTLSGGQRQRIAIARALTQEPKIILADEPVSSLDRNSAESVMACFRKINREDKITVITNLHDVALAKKYCSRIIGLRDGKIQFDKKAGDVDEITLHRLYQ